MLFAAHSLGGLSLKATRKDSLGGVGCFRIAKERSTSRRRGGKLISHQQSVRFATGRDRSVPAALTTSHTRQGGWLRQLREGRLGLGMIIAVCGRMSMPNRITLFRYRKSLVEKGMEKTRPRSGDWETRSGGAEGRRMSAERS
jgi:hypothetical protein